MKTKIKLLIFLIFIPIVTVGQEETDKIEQTDVTEQTEKTTVNVESIEEEGWNKRISFFVGAGTSVIINKVYELPIIDKTNNYVIIEESGSLKPNVSLGIVYTPFVYDIERYINYYDSNGDKKVKKIIEHVPKHFSVALFINPISLASANSNLSNTVDLGFGLGWRSDNFSAFLTMEFFSLEQPRDYFINEYKTNDNQYIIGGEVQTAIDVNDNSIFKNKVMTAFGLKIAYTFDIVKNYNNSAKF
ncbi:hypothetical protein [Formosa sp. 4Alg 33]|uniref:hypothetical protein n=1 Tax=Formosa sp. 4Alg 33 TaxID=3382189 RepID=UPI003D9C5337